jgi:hypothetical protein
MIHGDSKDGGPGTLVKFQGHTGSASAHNSTSACTEQQTKQCVTNNHRQTATLFRTIALSITTDSCPFLLLVSVLTQDNSAATATSRA